MCLPAAESWLDMAECWQWKLWKTIKWQKRGIKRNVHEQICCKNDSIFMVINRKPIRASRIWWKFSFCDLHFMFLQPEASDIWLRYFLLFGFCTKEWTKWEIVNQRSSPAAAFSAVSSPQLKLQHWDKGSSLFWFLTAVDVSLMLKQLGHKKSKTAQPRVGWRRNMQTWNQHWFNCWSLLTHDWQVH